MVGKRRSIVKRESIIGLPVFDGKNGEKLGVVKDLYFNGQSNRLEGLYVTNRDMGRNFIEIPFIDASLGYDAVIAEGKVFPHNADRAEDEITEKLLYKRVVREDGTELGMISDIIFDPLTGRIQGLELSEGIIGDLISGRQILPFELCESIKGDTLIISMEQAQNITPINRGIKNILINKLE